MAYPPLHPPAPTRCAAIPSLLVERSEAASKQSATVVLASLSHSAREVFRRIAEAQLEPEGEQGALQPAAAVLVLAPCRGWCAVPRSPRPPLVPPRPPRPPRTLVNAGVSFQRLFSGCREAFLVSNEMLLKAFLTEFRDHELLGTR